MPTYNELFLESCGATVDGWDITLTEKEDK